MLGKIIGVVCFIAAGISFFVLPDGIYFAVCIFVFGVSFWMVGICQSSLEKIEYFAEWQKNLLEKQRDQSKRIIYLLEKIAEEEHQGEEKLLQKDGKDDVVENKEVSCES